MICFCTYLLLPSSIEAFRATYLLRQTTVLTPLAGTYLLRAYETLRASQMTLFLSAIAWSLVLPQLKSKP